MKIWMTRNLNWNGGPEIGAMKLGSRLVPAYSGSATSGGYDPQDPYIERNPAYDEEESGGSVKGDQAVTDRHGRLYTLDEILLGTPAGGLGRGITSIEWPSAYNVGSTFVDAVGTQITARVFKSAEMKAVTDDERFFAEIRRSRPRFRASAPTAGISPTSATGTIWPMRRSKLRAAMGPTPSGRRC